jgi:hypothetical protein
VRNQQNKPEQKRSKKPEVDGDRVFLLAQEVTAVTGQNRVQHKSSIFFDKGNTCSMITKHLAGVRSFMHTEAIDTEFVAVELLREK